MEIAGVMSYERHELLRNRLINILSEPSPDDRYSKVSMQQVLAADRKAWEILARECVLGVRPVGDKLPLDEKIDDVLKTFEFSMCLLPLPRRADSGGGRKRKASASSGSSEGGKKSGRASRKKRQRENLNKMKGELAALRQGSGSGSAGSKGGGKGKEKGSNKRAPPVPTKLLPGRAFNDEGVPLCVGFNLGACEKAKRGESCDNGLHACTRLGCNEPHPSYECRRPRS